MTEPKEHILYILKNKNGHLYIGITNNLKRRLLEHKNLQGAKYTKDHSGFRLVYTERYNNLTEAIKREKQLKGWRRVKKEALILKDYKKLREL